MIKKVVWFINEGLSFSGGGERLLYEGLKYFSENGIDAYLYTNGNEIKPSALFNGKYNPNILKKKRTNRRIHKIFFVEKYLDIRESVIPIIQYKPDVIISNDLNSLVFLWKAKVLGLLSIPVVCFNHGSFFQFENDFLKYALIFKKNFNKIWSNDPVYKENISPIPPRLSFRKKFYNELLALILYVSVKYAKAIFVLTSKNKKEVQTLFHHKNVFNLHGAFPKNQFAEKLHKDKKEILNCSGKTVIFSLCRLEKKKKVDIIIKAFALYIKDNINSVLWIGGIGHYEEELRRQVKMLNIESNVIFIGFIPDEELRDFYTSADLFVCADNADYDITTFVALALGVKAVVSTQHEFEPELITNKLVILSNPIPKDFAEAFEISIHTDFLISNKRRISILESYTWDYYFRSVIEIIESVCLK
jgi:glycosyltransferase involved in cell wall biosynthesis